jgi:hypothetical protein
VRAPEQVPLALTLLVIGAGEKVTGELNEDVPANWHWPFNIIGSPCARDGPPAIRMLQRS